MGAMRVLVTGFGPFPGVPVNPSQQAVAELERRADAGLLPGILLSTGVLPVDFAIMPGQLAEMIRLGRPDVILCTGVDMGAKAISVERMATNLVDARIPDTSGAQPVDRPVVEGAPDGLLATVPVKAIKAAIERGGIPVELSLSAGSYACNAAMFTALHHAPKGTRAGFLHIPPVRVITPPTVAKALSAAIRACAMNETDLDEPGGELA